MIGYDASGEYLRRAQQVKAIDRRGSLRDALADADLVIVSTPVGAMQALFEEMAPMLPVDALVMDTGSTKAQVLDWAGAAPAERGALRGRPPHGWQDRVRPGCRGCQAVRRRRVVPVAGPDRAARGDRRRGQAGRVVGRGAVLPGCRPSTMAWWRRSATCRT